MCHEFSGHPKIFLPNGKYFDVNKNYSLETITIVTEDVNKEILAKSNSL